MNFTLKGWDYNTFTRACKCSCQAIYQRAGKKWLVACNKEVAITCCLLQSAFDTFSLSQSGSGIFYGFNPILFSDFSYLLIPVYKYHFGKSGLKGSLNHPLNHQVLPKWKEKLILAHPSGEAGGKDYSVYIWHHCSPFHARDLPTAFFH